MRIRLTPGADLSGEVEVPGDKSIAHRWLVLAATGRGPSRLGGLPVSLDVRSTAACLARLAPKARRALEVWARDAPPSLEGGRSTWNGNDRHGTDPWLEVEGDGRGALEEPDGPLDCGNSGTSMRLLSGVVASAPFTTTLTGDESLSVRPMDRVAEPLRAMGASVGTTDGHPPVVIRGGSLDGIRYTSPVASAQVKGAVLLAGIAADGRTTVVEPAPTRDHTERALLALGVPVRFDDGVTVERFQHEGFQASVPGDPSSAAFLVAAAALTRSSIVIRGVGLNPSRLHHLDVMERMGIRVERSIEAEELGEPVGSLRVLPTKEISSVTVTPDELPLVIDEVPILAMLAVHARSDSWFLGSGELRVKESDRLRAIVTAIRGLGGHAGDEGEDLVVGGGGLRGGSADAGGDHRMAMSLAVAALAADGPVEIAGMESADVSFPGFVATLSRVGVPVEVVG